LFFLITGFLKHQDNGRQSRRNLAQHINQSHTDTQPERKKLKGVNMTRQYLLSIDGGGIRGIIPAIALAELERVTGQRTRDIFSFVAGTSTGAIIAAAVAAGVPAERICDLYLKRAKEVFTNRPWNILKRVAGGSMYSTQKLHDLIADEIGPAREWRLNDSPIDLLISAKRMPDGMPWYFVRDNPRNSGSVGQLRLTDCVTASAAAPTYFQPWKINDTINGPSGSERVGELVDGGVGVTGNPVYQACIEAFDYTGGYSPDETTTVSLGTGRHISKQKPSGILQWLQWVLGQLLESPGEQQTKITKRQFPTMTFYRLDVDLGEDIALDDVGSVESLRKIGESFAQTIDWKAILAGSDKRFLISPEKTLWPQYKIGA
jgi:predicted acylesterase/phospholipase RssA